VDWTRTSSRFPARAHQLKVFINGEQVYYDTTSPHIEDNTYSGGSIGFGALSYGKEVDITFNYIETLKP
jgi:hypothetical protein